MSCEELLRQASEALYLCVDESIADDVNNKIKNVIEQYKSTIAEKDSKLAEIEKGIKEISLEFEIFHDHLASIRDSLANGYERRDFNRTDDWGYLLGKCTDISQLLKKLNNSETVKGPSNE